MSSTHVSHVYRFHRVGKLIENFLMNDREVDVERAILITNSYQETEGENDLIRRAKALDKILSNMTIRIYDGELIVGNQTYKPRAAPLFPEYAWEWILEQMDTFPTRKGDQFNITSEQKKILREILPYWKGKALNDFVSSMPESVRRAIDQRVICNGNYPMSGPGHLVPDHEEILSKGLKGIQIDIQKRMEKLHAGDPEFIKKFLFYKACLIACDAVIRFAKRYANLARQLAKTERELGRKSELNKIAKICEWVPANPARTFHEALQSLWFTQLVIQIEANGLSIAPGRFDQYMHPYYKQDLEIKRITREEALTLLECLFVKFNEIDKIYSNEATRFLQGPGHGQVLTLGGVTSDGRDATNELSYMCLEADADVGLVQPDLAIRIHNKLPDDFLMEVCGNIRLGRGKPKVFNDHVVIQSLLNLGVPLNEARDWGALGCSEPVISGKTNSWGNAGHINLVKCLELALNDGKCRLTGKEMGLPTGDPRNFTNFDDLIEAFIKQIEYFVKQLVILDNLLDMLHAKVSPLPFYSIITSDCIKKGVDFCDGGARYNFTSPLGVGLITVADSLAAVKKIVYEDKAIPMEQLLDSLDCNFERREEIRQMLLNKAPKFGNDNDYVDLLANEVLTIFCDEVRKYTNVRGGPFIAGLYYLTANIPFGMITGATPDGRKRGEPFNDGGISPVHGRDVKGPTAVACSVGKLDHSRVPHGSILNMRFNPALLESDRELKKFAYFIRTFIDLGGWHTQFNVISSETLRDAQKHPEQYRGLLIRVAGYNAYFTELETELQDDIIARTEHKSM